MVSLSISDMLRRQMLLPATTLARDYEIVGTVRVGDMDVAVRRGSPCLNPVKAAFAPR